MVYKAFINSFTIWSFTIWSFIWLFYHLWKVLRFDVGHRCPDTIHRFGIEGFDLSEKVFDFLPCAHMLEGAVLGLFGIVLHRGIGADVFFVDEAKGSYDTKRHLLHLQRRRHGRKSTLVDEVHEECLDDIVPMMPESNLGTP